MNDEPTPPGPEADTEAAATQLYQQVISSTSEAMAELTQRLPRYCAHPPMWGRMLAEMQTITAQLSVHLAECAESLAHFAAAHGPTPRVSAPAVYGVPSETHAVYWQEARDNVGMTANHADYAAVFGTVNLIPAGAALRGEPPLTEHPLQQEPVMTVVHRDDDPAAVLALHCGGMTDDHVRAEMETRDLTIGTPVYFLPPEGEAIFNSTHHALYDVYGREVSGS